MALGGSKGATIYQGRGNTGNRIEITQDYSSTLFYTETLFLGGNPSQFEPEKQTV